MCCLCIVFVYRVPTLWNLNIDNPNIGLPNAELFSKLLYLKVCSIDQRYEEFYNWLKVEVRSACIAIENARY